MKAKKLSTPRSLSSKEFARIAIQVEDWMTTDDIVTLCDQQNFWPYEFLEDAIANIKKVAVRNLARRKVYQDEAGNPIELVSIIQRNEEAQKDERVYKQLSLFEEFDFVQVITDRWDRRRYWDSEIKRFLKLALEKFGDHFQGLLPFLPEDFDAVTDQ
jgi:hypothetical protein